MALNDLLTESFHDLKDDFEELEYLASSVYSNIVKFEAEIPAITRHIPKHTLTLAQKNIRYFKKKFAGYLSRLQSLKLQTTNHPSINLLENLQKSKAKYFDLIRTNMEIISSLLTSLDWQSPSFNYSLHSQAGRQTGKTKGTINDYKRDRHLDEEGFEKLYIKRYIDARFKPGGLRAFMTGSGMSAFTTIFNFLIMNGKIKNKVLLGKSSYFQYKHILIKSLKGKIVEFDETKTENLIELIKRERPSVIFTDSLCNAGSIPITNLKALVKYLTRSYKNDIYLVIDNTGLSVSSQIFGMAAGRKGKLHIIVFESLMKYIHFGLDRVTGGIIVASGKDAGLIFECRKHLGTNISDSSVYSFPKPNRKLLEKRLKRFNRNAYILASFLQEYIKTHKTAFEKIVYPGLPYNRKVYTHIQNMPFHGSFFNIEFTRKTKRLYKQFVNIVINEAKKQKVDLIAGTSFGLNTTRVYLTSFWTNYAEPFVRISVGTETIFQVEKMKKVFIQAMKKTSRFRLI